MGYRRIWTKAASTALAVTLGAFACAPALTAGIGAAWANATYGTGSVKILKNAENGATSFDAYQIFRANVDGDDKTTATKIAWSGDAVRAAVENALKAWGGSGSTAYTGTTAQEAADYISAHLNGSATGASTRVSSESLAQAIARALAAADSGVTPGASNIQPDLAEQLSEGYWLLVTSPASTAADAGEEKASVSGTSPIFVGIAAGQTTEVSEKTSLPTIQKAVTDDGNETREGEGHVADAFLGQDLDFTLTGTVSDNIASFETYSYAFEDELDEELELAGTTGESGAFTPDNSSWYVKAYQGTPGKIPGTDISKKCYSTTYKDHKLTVSFGNLKALKAQIGSASIPVTADTRIVVSYKAHLTGSAAVGWQHENKAKLRYSNNPVTSSTGVTTAKSAYVYTYGLELDKVDRATGQPLQGAKFALQFLDDGFAKDKYVAASRGEDGAYRVTGVADAPQEFESDSNGRVRVYGLNAGTYRLRETGAPQGYRAIGDQEFMLIGNYSADGGANPVNVAGGTGGEFEWVEPEKATGNGTIDYGTMDLAGKVRANATASFTVSDPKEIALPLTGMSGVAFTWVAGAGVLLVTAAYAARSRRRNRRAE